MTFASKAALFLLVLWAGAFGACPPAVAMSFDAAGDQLVLAGPVERGDFDRFKAIVERNRFKIDAVVLLDSPGGAAADGFMIGDLIREKRYRTIAAGACYSACALIFLGGVERQFAEGSDERALVAFHGLYFRDGSLAQEVTGVNRDWVMRRTDRWIDDSLLRQWTRFADPRDFVYFLPAESARRRFGAAVLVCRAGGESARTRNDCQRIADTDAYREGIATSRAPARLDPRLVETLRARR